MREKYFMVKTLRLNFSKAGSPYKAVQVIKKRVIISRNVLIFLGHSFEMKDVTC